MAVDSCNGGELTKVDSGGELTRVDSVSATVTTPDPVVVLSEVCKDWSTNVGLAVGISCGFGVDGFPAATEAHEMFVAGDVGFFETGAGGAAGLCRFEGSGTDCLVP